MAETPGRPEQDAQVETQQGRQEAAPAQPPAQTATAGRGTPLTGETAEEMKARLNEEAKRYREAKEAADARAKALETELAQMREKAEQEKKERERAEMSAVQRAEAERDDVQKQLAEERRRSNTLTVQQTATQLASEMGFRNPAMAAKLVDVSQVLKDGSMDMDALKLQMASVAASNEYMLNRPPPPPYVGPTNNPAAIDPQVTAPPSINLRPGADPMMALMQQKKEIEDRMRAGDVRAPADYVNINEQIRNAGGAAVRQGRMFGNATPK